MVSPTIIIIIIILIRLKYFIFSASEGSSIFIIISF